MLSTEDKVISPLPPIFDNHTEPLTDCSLPSPWVHQLLPSVHRDFTAIVTEASLSVPHRNSGLCSALSWHWQAGLHMWDVLKGSVDAVKI